MKKMNDWTDRLYVHLRPCWRVVEDVEMLLIWCEGRSDLVKVAQRDGRLDCVNRWWGCTRELA